MKVYRMLCAALLVVALLGSLAAAEGYPLSQIDDPAAYVGIWGAGEDYGDTREYYMYITNYADGCFTLNLDIYRVWSFENMTAMLLDDDPSAMLVSDKSDDYLIVGLMTFAEHGFELEILESDYDGLKEGTKLAFEPVEFEEEADEPEAKAE